MEYITNKNWSLLFLFFLTKKLVIIFFETKINNIHSFKLMEYIDTIQIQIR